MTLLENILAIFYALAVTVIEVLIFSFSAPAFCKLLQSLSLSFSYTLLMLAIYFVATCFLSKKILETILQKNLIYKI